MAMALAWPPMLFRGAAGSRTPQQHLLPPGPALIENNAENMA
jgi:hypothetical protein